MQVEVTRMYRVKAVANMLDVSLATIYRAVESGKLEAVRMGEGAGALRISGQAITNYVAACTLPVATAVKVA